jgi:hypothetical protein
MYYIVVDTSMYDGKAPRLALGNWIRTAAGGMKRFAALVDLYDGAHWLRFDKCADRVRTQGPLPTLWLVACGEAICRDREIVEVLLRVCFWAS